MAKKGVKVKPWNRRRSGRRANSRALREYYLIVCEGAKTEPNYFEGLKKDLPREVLTSCYIDIQGTGFNTVSLVQEAQRLKKELEQQRSLMVDHLWVVMDKDSFTPQNFNAAIQACANRTPVVHCAWTNEAFELWYLLHFHFCNSGITRQQYLPLITKALQPHLGQNWQYRKGDPEVYQHLKTYGNQDQAIDWADQLKGAYQGRQDFANHNPRTEVHELVKKLMKHAR